jgi:hypothetical protein
MSKTCKDGQTTTAGINKSTQGLHGALTEHLHADGFSVVPPVTVLLCSAVQVDAVQGCHVRELRMERLYGHHLQARPMHSSISQEQSESQKEHFSSCPGALSA